MIRRSLVKIAAIYFSFFTVTLCSGQKNNTDFVNDLLKRMTLKEKVGQMAQITLDVVGKGKDRFTSEEPFGLDSAKLERALVEYKVGSVLNTSNNRARTPEVWYHIVSGIQRVAIKKTRLGIPVIYGIDAVLSYTTFNYSAIRLSSDTFNSGGKMTISVDVTNTGNREGKEVVQLYISDVVASGITPDVKRLRGFEKIGLKPAETRTVVFTISPDDIAFVNAENKRVTESGEFIAQVADRKISFQFGK